MELKMEFRFNIQLYSTKSYVILHFPVHNNSTLMSKLQKKEILQMIKTSDLSSCMCGTERPPCH